MPIIKTEKDKRTVMNDMNKCMAEMLQRFLRSVSDDVVKGLQECMSRDMLVTESA